MEEEDFDDEQIEEMCVRFIKCYELCKTMKNQLDRQLQVLFYLELR